MQGLHHPYTWQGDHIFGLLPFLASRLNGAGGVAEGLEDPRLLQQLTNVDPRDAVEIYGPLGTRAYVRNGLAHTYTLLGGPYVVHELRFPNDPQSGDHTDMPLGAMELPSGRNITQFNGVWPDIFSDEIISVSAAPIHHSVPCVGYVVQEKPVPGKVDPKKYIPELKRTNSPMSLMASLQRGQSVTLSDGTVLEGPPRRPGRKIVILGDTYDPSPIASLAEDAHILIHEATNAHLPGIDPNTKAADSYEVLEERSKSRGHSTPQMAGLFAKRIRAKKLILNHFSSRYPGNDDTDEEASKVMRAIGGLAQEKFGGEVICARDFMSIGVPLSEEGA